MLKKLKVLLVLCALFPFAYIVNGADVQHHIIGGIDVAKQELKDALKGNPDRESSMKNLITDKQTAIAVAEPILFKVYGQKQIMHEKPYEIYLINGYWVINGTLPEKQLGGTFLIILSANDGKVIKLTHYK